jgi:hypothetical protein
MELKNRKSETTGAYIEIILPVPEEFQPDRNYCEPETKDKIDGPSQPKDILEISQ